MRVYAGGVVEERKTTDAAAMPTTTSKVQEAGRLPSIEMEPKTLTLDQIEYAREAALYVVSTKSEEEAIRIFTAGLKPVRTAKNVWSRSSSVVDSSDDDVDLDGSSTGGRGGKLGGRRGRRTSSALDDIRDVATAPF